MNTCSDCGNQTKAIAPETLAKGSAVREPGEALCPSCNSSRTRLIRILLAIPTSLDQIKAARLKVNA